MWQYHCSRRENHVERQARTPSKLWPCCEIGGNLASTMRASVSSCDNRLFSANLPVPSEWKPSSVSRQDGRLESYRSEFQPAHLFPSPKRFSFGGYPCLSFQDSLFSD